MRARGIILAIFYTVGGNPAIRKNKNSRGIHVVFIRNLKIECESRLFVLHG